MKIRRKKKLDVLIGNGVLEYENHMIQIRNITRIGCGKLDIKIPYFKIVIGFIVGCILISTSGVFKTVGVIVVLLSLISAGYYFYMLTFSSLNFQLASGEIVAFESQNLQFLKDCYSQVRNIIEKGDTILQDIKMDFSNAKISNSDVIVAGGDVKQFSNISDSIIDSNIRNSSVKKVDGDDFSNSGMNVVNSTTGNIQGNKMSSNNFKQIESDLVEIRKQASESDQILLDQAIELARKKDEKGLKKFLKNLPKNLNDLLSTVSSIVTIFSVL